MTYTDENKRREWQRNYYKKHKAKILEREKIYRDKNGWKRNERRRLVKWQKTGNPIGKHLEPLVGNKNGRWKGGWTKEGRYDPKFLELRLKIFKRDNYTCQICGIRNGLGEEIGFTMHHIKEWDKYPDLRFDESNCQTLCWPCHFKLHHPNSDVIVPLDWTKKGQKRWNKKKS